MINTSQFFWRD